MIVQCQLFFARDQILVREISLCYSAISILPATPALQASLMKTGLRTFCSKNLENNVVFLGSQGGVPMVGHQSNVKQWEVPSNWCETTDDYSIRWINENFRVFFPRTQNRGTLVKTGSKRTYKRCRIQSSKICHNDIHIICGNIKISLLSNEQHIGTSIHQKGNSQ